jgi:hypothetical protein
MVDSMEGVVADAEQPKEENVEQKTVAGKSDAITTNMVTFTCPCTYCTSSGDRHMCPNFMIATNLASNKYLYPDRADPTAQDIRASFTLLERAVTQFDTRFTLRALRSISSLRKRLTDRVLCSVIVLTYSPSNATARVLIEAIGMDGETIQSVASQYKEEIQQNKGNTKEPIPEIDVYIAILIQVCQQTHKPRYDADALRFIYMTKRTSKKVPNSRLNW